MKVRAQEKMRGKKDKSSTLRTGGRRKSIFSKRSLPVQRRPLAAHVPRNNCLAVTEPPADILNPPPQLPR